MTRDNFSNTTSMALCAAMFAFGCEAPSDSHTNTESAGLYDIDKAQARADIDALAYLRTFGQPADSVVVVEAARLEAAIVGSKNASSIAIRAAARRIHNIGLFEPGSANVVRLTRRLAELSSTPAIVRDQTLDQLLDAAIFASAQGFEDSLQDELTKDASLEALDAVVSLLNDDSPRTYRLGLKALEGLENGSVVNPLSAKLLEIAVKASVPMSVITEYALTPQHALHHGALDAYVHFGSFDDLAIALGYPVFRRPRAEKALLAFGANDQEPSAQTGFAGTARGSYPLDHLPVPEPMLTTPLPSRQFTQAPQGLGLGPDVAECDPIKLQYDLRRQIAAADSQTGRNSVICTSK